jgi:hypothetical protein
LLLAPGTTLRTVAGRAIVFPRIRATAAGLRTLADWLITEARADCLARGDDYQHTLMLAKNARSFSPSDSADCNLVLFGDEDGPTAGQVIAEVR